MTDPVVHRAPPAAGAVGLLASAPVYGLLHILNSRELLGGDVHFLLRMLITFLVVTAIMAVITVVQPLREPRVMPVKESFDMETSPLVKVAGGLVIAAVAVFFYIFW